jgi:hypothetical protein
MMGGHFQGGPAANLPLMNRALLRVPALRVSVRRRERGNELRSLALNAALRARTP